MSNDTNEMSLEAFERETQQRAARILWEKEVFNRAVVIAQLWVAMDKTQQGAVMLASGSDDFGVEMYKLVHTFKDASVALAIENPHGQREW